MIIDSFRMTSSWAEVRLLLNHEQSLRFIDLVKNFVAKENEDAQQISQAETDDGSRST